MTAGMHRLGKYELQKRLASSKMAEVWIGYDPAWQRRVLIKVFATPVRADSETMAHFRASAERLASLRHSGIARLYDLSVAASPEPDSRSASHICLVLEYIEGYSLAEYLPALTGRGNLRLDSELARVFASVSLALDEAHRQGVIHGNLKPSNLFLRRANAAAGQIGEPVLTDFALAKRLTSSSAASHPFYLSPEQIRGQEASERSDIYSLGVILYELCTGMLPFRGTRPIAIMAQHVNTPPTPPMLLNPTISSSLSNVLLQSLEKEPQRRFPSATHMAVALARALHTSIPDAVWGSERGRQIVRELEASAVPASPTSELLLFSQPVPTPPRQKMAQEPAAEKRTGRPLLARWKPSGPTHPSFWYLTGFVALLLATLATLGTLLLSPHPGKEVLSDPLVGHAFFLNSGQISASGPQGINDELQVNLSDVPAPPAGKRYDAWLLADASVSEALPLALGPLSLERGRAQLLYRGDGQHANLLGVASRFLITVDDAAHPTSNPLLDTSTWRYYAEIPQEPIPGDELHFSLLAHLRHLLVESPELQVRGLHGGLAFWFVRNTLTVMQLANSARDDWNNRDLTDAHNQVVRLLDFLDGASFVQTDVPAATPGLSDARLTQVPLLGPVPHNPDAPGYGYQNEVPPGYVYLLSEHMSGAIRSPQTSAGQRQLAIQINRGLDEGKRLLQQMEQDAKQLAHMSQAQLGQSSSLSLLNDLATQAQDAYAGQPDPASGQSTNGALWIYQQIQRLATFDIRPYRAAGQ